jgi:hypothetical protein
LSIQCQLDIFDKTVKPILLYGCETWGFGKNDIIERVHLKFCKLLLHVKTSTPNVMVYVLYTIVCMIVIKFLTDFLKWVLINMKSYEL